MSFGVRTKIVLSSEYLSLDLSSETEDLIPHPEDPIRDMAKNYWTLTETGVSNKTEVPTTDEDNKIFLNEDKNYYTDTLHEEFVRIFDYKHTEDVETVTLMQPDPSKATLVFSAETMLEIASWVSDT